MYNYITSLRCPCSKPWNVWSSSITFFICLTKKKDTAQNMRRIRGDIMAMIKTECHWTISFSLSSCPFFLTVGKQFLTTKMYSFAGLLVTPSYGFSISISKALSLMGCFFYDIVLAKLWAHLMVYSPRKANTSHLRWTNYHALMLCAISKLYLVQLLHTIFIIQHWLMWTDVKFVKCFTSVRFTNFSILT